MFKKFKVLVVGFILGVVFSSGFAYADNIQASIMQCKILFNENYYEVSDPVLNYNGRAYVPLREFARITQTDIKWDDIYKTIVMNKKPEVKEIVKIVEIPKETKEVIKGKFGNIDISLKNGFYSVRDLDYYGSGYTYMFDEKASLVSKYINDNLEYFYFLQPKN